jgi:hypothetical protein
MTHVALKVKEFCDAFEAGHSEKYSNDVYEIYMSKRKIVSILINNGVRLVVKEAGDDGKKEELFICLAGNCGEKRSDAGILEGSKVKIYTSSTDKATKHLSHVHAIQSLKSATAAQNVARLDGFEKNCHPAFNQDPTRFFGNCLAILSARHGIPFHTWHDDAWNLFQRQIPNIPRDGLKNLNPRKQLVELYCHIKKGIIAEIVDARLFFCKLPFLAFNLDLYQDPVQNLKYLAIRISWTNPKTNVLASYPLAMREYSQTFAERQVDCASKILYTWAKVVFLDFGIQEHELLAGSGDGGSDVKKAMDTYFTMLLREWCLAHLLNRALIDAFGGSVDKTKSKNKEARKVIDACKKTIETLNKSTDLKLRYDELTVNAGQHSSSSKKSVIKIKNAPHHRWGAQEGVMLGLLRGWVPLHDAFDLTVGKTSPIENHHVIIQEFYSLMNLVRRVQIESQKIQEFVLVKVYVQLIAMYHRLSPSAPLLMVHPKRPEELLRMNNEQGGPDERANGQLDQRTQDVKKKLRVALNSRFFKRFHPVKALKNWKHVYGLRAHVTEQTVTIDDFVFDMVFDLSLLLYPATSELKHVDKLCEKVDISNEEIACLPRASRNIPWLRLNNARLVKAALWEKVKALAIVPARVLFRKMQGQEPVVAPGRVPQTPPAAKRRKAADDWLAEAGLNSPDQDGGSDDNTPVAPTRFQSATELLEDEIMRYKAIKLRTKDERTCEMQYIAQWWDMNTKDFPCLRMVAKAIFGMLPGSGALECDIGGFKDIIAPKRGLLDPGMVEVLLMVRLNKPLTEYDIGKIATLPCDTWQTKIPKGRPTLPTDYFAGEDAEQAAQQAAAEQTAVDCEEAQAQQAALEEESVGDSGE